MGKGTASHGSMSLQEGLRGPGGCSAAAGEEPSDRAQVPPTPVFLHGRGEDGHPGGAGFTHRDVPMPPVSLGQQHLRCAGTHSLPSPLLQEGLKRRSPQTPP